MRRRPELMQLEMGMSTMRYLPASGTAGLARSLVSGNNRVPWPPPIMTDSTLLVFMVCRPVCDISKILSREKFLKESYTPGPKPARRSFTRVISNCEMAVNHRFGRRRFPLNFSDLNFCFGRDSRFHCGLLCGGRPAGTVLADGDAPPFHFESRATDGRGAKPPNSFTRRKSTCFL